MKRCSVCRLDKTDFSFMSPDSKMCIACLQVTPSDPRSAAFGHTVPADWFIRHKLAPSLAESPQQAAPDDGRPIIDQIHEGTFTDPTGLRYIKDKYALRMMLRKAQRFVLDSTTSALVGDFSVAVSDDLEASRRLAVPPFPVTWFEIDNTARMKRVRELGVKVLDANDPNVFDKDTKYHEVIARCGWLIQPATENGGYCATYFTSTQHGAVALPMAYYWHNNEPDSIPYNVYGDNNAAAIREMQWMLFGMTKCNVHPTDAHLYPSPLHVDVGNLKQPPKSILEMMAEMAGEMRHIWGLLIALSAGQLGVNTDTSGAVRHAGAPKTMPNGKPLLALEHKTLHLHLAKRSTPAKVLLRAITQHKKRWHRVRTHFRTYRNEDGSVHHRTEIAAHERGDARLGRIEKTYRIER